MTSNKGSVSQMDPTVVSLASDRHGDKRDSHGRFVDSLDLVYKDALACIRLIYGSKRYTAIYLTSVKTPV